MERKKSRKDQLQNMIWAIRVWLASQEVIVAIYGKENGFYRQHMHVFSPDRLMEMDDSVITAIYRQIIADPDLDTNFELFEFTCIYFIPIAEEVPI